MLFGRSPVSGVRRIGRVWRSVREALADRTGAVMILTAVCAPVLLLIVGVTADYGYASYINQRLARATDSAILGAVSQSTATAGGGYGNTAWLQSQGVKIFNANIAGLSLANVSFTLNVTTDGAGNVTAAGAYSYQSPTFFAGIIGRSTLPMSGTMQATAHPIVYLNYYLVADTSQSMGIAATQTDMQTLYDRVVANNNGSNGDVGCVFACHEKGLSIYGYNQPQPYTNEDLAHNLTKTWGPRITLRIDSAVTAIQGILSIANTIAGVAKNISFGLYTISTDAKDGSNLEVVSDPSSDYTTLSNLAGAITLQSTYAFGNSRSGSGASDFASQFSQFNNKIPSNGSGASAVSPLNYVFIVTDGFSDTPNSSQNCVGSYNCFPIFDPANCNSLKNKAVVGVIYTTYLPIYQNNDKSQGLENLFSLAVGGSSKRRDLAVLPALQSCATSSDYFFQADDGPALIAAMQALFLKTQPVSARLTQ